MEYLAFGLLGIGTIFIFIGILSAREKDSKVQESTPKGTAQPFVVSHSLEKVEEKIPYTESVENALVLSKNATLYIDKSGKNIYENHQNQPALFNTSSIHRVGPGNFTFNGFTFVFTNLKGKETLPISEVARMSFYPNCIAISKKNSTTTLIFFIDNTKQIKSILDQHLTPHVTQ